MSRHPSGTRIPNRPWDRSPARTPVQANPARSHSGSPETRSSARGTILYPGRSATHGSSPGSLRYHTPPRPSSFLSPLPGFDQSVCDTVALHLDRIPDLHVPAMVLDLAVEHLVERRNEERLSLFVHVQPARHRVEERRGNLLFREEVH